MRANSPCSSLWMLKCSVKIHQFGFSTREKNKVSDLSSLHKNKSKKETLKIFANNFLLAVSYQVKQKMVSLIQILLPKPDVVMNGFTKYFCTSVLWMKDARLKCQYIVMITITTTRQILSSINTWVSIQILWFCHQHIFSPIVLWMYFLVLEGTDQVLNWSSCPTKVSQPNGHWQAEHTAT